MFVYRPDICVQIQPNVRLSDIYDKKTYIQVFNVPYKSFDIGKLFIDIKIGTATILDITKPDLVFFQRLLPFSKQFAHWQA